MKNTICEKLMWAAMTPTMFKFINENCGEVDAAAIKKKAHKNYKAMVERTPDIGSFMKNTLRVSLAGGICYYFIWLNHFFCGI